MDQISLISEEDDNNIIKLHPTNKSNIDTTNDQN
jgi:hypothetical protein